MNNELRYLFQFDVSSNCRLFTYREVISVITQDLYYLEFRAERNLKVR